MDGRLCVTPELAIVTGTSTSTQPLFSIRITGDGVTGRLLGAQLIGTQGAEISQCVDTYATALFHGMALCAMTELVLSYTPPLGSPWDAVPDGYPVVGHRASARRRARHPHQGQRTDQTLVEIQ